MLINVNKCLIHVVYIRYNLVIGCISKCSTSVKDLGVWLSNDLSFTVHLDYIYKKALQVVGFIKRNSWEFNNPICIKVLYCSLVRTILEYCSVVWNPVTDLWTNELESVQNQFFLLFSCIKIEATYKR